MADPILKKDDTPLLLALLLLGGAALAREPRDSFSPGTTVGFAAGGGGGAPDAPPAPDPLVPEPTGAEPEPTPEGPPMPDPILPEPTRPGPAPEPAGSPTRSRTGPDTPTGPGAPLEAPWGLPAGSTGAPGPLGLPGAGADPQAPPTLVPGLPGGAPLRTPGAPERTARPSLTLRTADPALERALRGVRAEGGITDPGAVIRRSETDAPGGAPDRFLRSLIYGTTAAAAAGSAAIGSVAAASAATAAGVGTGAASIVAAGASRAGPAITTRAQSLFGAVGRGAADFAGLTSAKSAAFAATLATVGYGAQVATESPAQRAAADLNRDGRTTFGERSAEAARARRARGGGRDSSPRDNRSPVERLPSAAAIAERQGRAPKPAPQPSSPPPNASAQAAITRQFSGWNRLAAAYRRG